MKRISIAVIVFAVFGSAFGQEAHKYRIIVSCVCQDSAGQSVASSLRDQIAESPRYAEIPDRPDNLKTALKMTLLSKEIPGATASSIAIVLTSNGIFYDLWVADSSSESGSKTARKLLVSLDEDIANWESQIASTAGK